MRTPVLLVLALLVAGCASPAAKPTPSAAAPAATTPAGPADNVTMAVAPNATAARPAIAPLAFDGVTPAYVEACAGSTGTGQCADAPPNADFSKAAYEPALNGTPTALKVTVTWTSASPANDQMTLVVQDRAGSGGTVLATQTGPSPLTVDLPKLQLKGHLSFILPGPGEADDLGAAWALFSGSPQDQPWKLAGTVTLVPK